MNFTLHFILILTFILVCQCQTLLEIVGLFSYQIDDWGPLVEPAFNLAIEEINANDALLNGYVLKGIVGNSGCSNVMVVESFLEIMSNSTNVVGVIGPQCSAAAIAVVPVAQYWELPVISYSATSPELSDTEKYPNFARVVPSDSFQARAWIDLCLQYNWTDVAIINAQDTLNEILSAEFETLAEEYGIRILASVSVPVPATEVSVVEYVQSLSDSGASVFFIAAYASETRMIGLAASEIGIIGRGYSWVGSDAAVSPSLLITEELQNIFLGWLGTTPAGGNSTARDAVISTLLSNGYPETTVFSYAEYTYDAVYVLAYAIQRLVDSGKNTADPTFTSFLIDEIINGTDFKGITAGRVAFTSSGDRLVPFNIKNVEGENLYQIAQWDNEIGLVFVAHPLWPGNFRSTVFGERPPAVIHIGGLFPGSGGWPVGHRVEPAFFMAVEDINNDDTLLQHYVIKPISRDTKCDPLIGLEKYFEIESLSGLNAIGFVGAGCSIVSQAVSQVAELSGTPIVSWGSTSPALSVKDNFPTFLRTVSPDTIQGHAAYAFVHEMGWEKVAVLNSNEDLHAQLVNEFLIRAEDDEDLQVLAKETFQGSSGVTSFDVQLKTIKNQGARVILLAGYVEDVRAIFRQAASDDYNMIEGYTWIGTDAWILNNMWVDDEDISDDVVREAVQGAIGFGPAPGLSEESDAFRVRILNITGESDVYVYAETTYDAVYVYANQLHQMLELEKQIYTTEAFRWELTERMKIETSFYGVSRGRVYFDENADRLIPYEVLNFQNNELVRVAIWDSELGYFPDAENKIVWSDGVTFGEYPDGRSVPLDSPKTVYYTIPQEIALLFSVLAGVIVVLTILFVIFIIINLDNLVIEAARPIFCILIAFGCLCASGTIYTQLIETVTPAICMLTPILGHFAFIITVSLIYAKSWRIYKVFGTDSFEIVKITDIDLLIWVGCACGIYLLFFIIWGIVDPLGPVEVTDPGDNFLKYTICKGDFVIFEIILYVFEGILLLFGAFLAFKTRNVQWLQYNESSYVALVVYNLTFMGAVLLPLTYLLTDDQQSAKYVISSSGMLVVAFVVIGLLFYQKFTYVRKEQKGTLNLSGTTQAVQTSTTSRKA